MVRILKSYSPKRIAAELINQLLGYEYLKYQDGTIVFQHGPRYIMRRVGISNHLILSTRMYVFVDENRFSTLPRDVSRHMDELIMLIPDNLRVPASVFTSIAAHTAGSQSNHKPIRTLLSETGLVNFQDVDKQSNSYRFTCTYVHLNAFDMQMSTEFPEIAMAKYGCGIYVDEYDALTCVDDEILWQLDPTCFRAHDIPVELSETVTLTAGTQPLALQLHNTRDVYAPEYTKYRDRLNKPVRVGQRDWFVLDAPKISLDSETRSDKLCARCRGVLYDECYILLNQTDDAKPYSIALHPICLHVAPKEAAPEDEFTHVFRVQFPTRCADFATHADPVIADVYAHALKGIARVEYVWQGIEIVYYTIGDKYVYFMHGKDYQFRACKLDCIRGRIPITNVNIVHA